MSTVTEPKADPGNAITVDVQISEVILAAALARLPFVQQVERRNHGKATTNLSTLAMDILKNWKPGDTQRPKDALEAECPKCHRVVKTYATGKLRVHGAPGERCPTAFVKGARRKMVTRPLRFPMNRDEYETARDRIHIHGQSVASVISQRLKHFALKGSL